MQAIFLGANSKNGFASLYHGFPPEEAYLTVIKGGPGTGKSTFLRKLAAAAESHGMQVLRVLCSGDPDSLDGIYIPGLRRAWVDGTAPHVMEPDLFCVTGEYLDLGAFLQEPFSAGERQSMLALQKEYRSLYAHAYRILAACHRAGYDNTEEQAEDGALSWAGSLQPKEGSSPILRCFIRAITAKGVMDLTQALASVKILPANAGSLLPAAQKARERGRSVALCFSPLDPTRPELLLLEEEKLAFRTKAAPSPEGERLLQEAVALLRQAKALHDRLEDAYRPHMDYAGLSKYTQGQIRKLFP